MWYWRRREETVTAAALKASGADNSNGVNGDGDMDIDAADEEDEAMDGRDDESITTDLLCDYPQGPYAQCDTDVDGVTVRMQTRTWRPVYTRKQSAFTLSKPDTNNGVTVKELAFDMDTTLRVGRTVYLHQFAEHARDYDELHEMPVDQYSDATRPNVAETAPPLIGVIEKLTVCDGGTAVRITLGDYHGASSSRFVVPHETGQSKHRYVWT